MKRFVHRNFTAKTKKKEWEVKLVESLASVFDPEPENREVKSLYERFVKADEMHEVPPPITRTFMPTSYKSDLQETQSFMLFSIVGFLLVGSVVPVKVIQNGNSMKKTRRDHDRRVIILPPTTAKEHIVVQRESKARTTLLQSIPNDHVADFHYMDDARNIWNAVKARMQKILSQLNQLKAKPKDEDINLKFLRALPSSWSQVALTLKTKEQQLAYKDFEQIEKLDLEEMDLKWQMAMLSVRVHKFEQKTRRKIDFDKKESASAKGGNDKQRNSSFKIKEIGKKEEYSKALITVDTLVDWTDHDGESDRFFAFKEFGMIAGCDTEDAIEEGAAKIYNLITRADTEEASTAGDAEEFAFMGITSKVHNCPFGCDNKYNELNKQYNELNEQNGEYFIQVQAYKKSLKTLEKQKKVLQRNQLTLEDKIRVLSIELENTSNLLKHFKRINADVETAKKDLQTKLDNHLENELGWDDSAFSVFTTNFEDMEGIPLFHRFAKTDSMKAVSLPHSGDYTSLSDISDLDESQMSYVTSLQSVSTSENEAKIESNVGTPIQEPIIVQDLPSFSCNSSDKNEHISRTSCNKNGYFNKKAGHFRKNASFVFKLCFVYGSGTHLIKDYDIYEKQIANKTTGKVNIPPARPQPVPTGKPKVFASVPTGWPNRPFPVPTDRGYSPSENPFLAAEDERLFDSGCSRSMTGNKERLDDFQEFQGRKVTFGGGEGIKREYSNARTTQQNKVADRKNKTLIEAARTMLADSKLHTMFWTEAFDGKADDDYIVGYFASNKAYKVYSVPNKRVEETINLWFLKAKPNVQGLGHEWYFDLDYLTGTLGYKLVQANQSAGTQGAVTNPTGTQGADSDSDYNEQVIIVPSYPSHNISRSEPKDTSGDEVDDYPLHFADEIFQKELPRLKGQAQRATSDAESLGLGFANDAEELQSQVSVKTVPLGCIPVPTGNVLVHPSSLPVSIGSIPVPTGNTMVSTDNVSVHTSSSTDSFFDDEPTTRFPSPSDHGNHDPLPGIFSFSSYDDEFGAALNNVASTVETTTGNSAFVSSMYDQQRDNHTYLQHCLFACFLSQVKPKSVAQALEDPSWVDAMQEEMQQFKFQNVWVLIDLPKAQGHKQEEGIDYDEVFAPVARIEAIRMFLAFASYLGFIVYQIDVKSAFLYERIDEEQQPNGIFINQDKYVQEILNKFDLGSVKTATTPYEATKLKSKNKSDSPVNVHLYRSMIGSLMYLTASRPDIMFAVSACLRNQVTPTTSNLEAVKKIFKYLKGQAKLGLWYPKESPFVIEAYSNSDYAGANKDRKSTTGGCQFLGRRLISWQCKKQTIAATSSTEAEYVVATK
nr:ribonuclease H-like domain, reverse transcriptase, RNA-dependent DNA polymerase [Tanacetum cinerariifolium]